MHSSVMPLFYQFWQPAVDSHLQNRVEVDYRYSRASAEVMALHQALVLPPCTAAIVPT